MTGRQKEKLDFIKDYYSKNHQSPTLKEICDEFGKSMRTIIQHLDSLERQGFIFRKKYEHRGIILLRNEEICSLDNGMEKVPISSLIGCDNACVFGEDQIQDHVLVSKKMIQEYGKLVAGRALGFSMTNEDIYPDDILIIKPSKKEPKNGEIVVFRMGDMVLAKKVRISEKSITFLPSSDSDEYKPLVFDKKDDGYKIIGTVVDIIKRKDNSAEDYQYIKECEI